MIVVELKEGNLVVQVINKPHTLAVFPSTPGLGVSILDWIQLMGEDTIYYEDTQVPIILNHLGVDLKMLHTESYFEGLRGPNHQLQQLQLSLCEKVSIMRAAHVK